MRIYVPKKYRAKARKRPMAAYRPQVFDFVYRMEPPK